MSLTNAYIGVLASMVIVLAGMVGYMFWQQSHILQIVNSLTSYVSTQFVKTDDSVDDRVSVSEKEVVEKEVEVVENVNVPTTGDSVDGKTSSELKELLSAKGVPYGKRDSKTALLKLVKDNVLS